MKARIRRAKDWEQDYGKWVVGDNHSADVVGTFGAALRFWLWHMGVPAKIAFWKLKE